MKRIQDFQNIMIDKKVARNRLIKYLGIKNILGINKWDFIIYSSFFVFSLVLIVPYFVNQSKVQTVLMSIGCSLIGAVLLAYFIALRSERTSIQKAALEHNKFLYKIYGTIYSISSNPKIVDINGKYNELEPIIKGRENHIKRGLKELDDLVNQYIDIYGENIDQTFYDKLCDISIQVSEFLNNFERVSCLESIENMALFLNEGIPNWFNKNIDEHFVIDNYIG